MPDRRVIGVDMGGTKLLAGAVDGRLSVHHRLQRPLTGLDQPKLLDTVTEAVQEAIDNAGGEVDAVGFGIPCTFDQRTGTAVLAINLDMKDLAFGAIMSERLGVSCYVDNDANMAALAELRAGVATGVNDALMLTIGTGIGGGLILNGALYRGSIGAGAELGHMVIQADGPRCQGNCPNRGCVESLASGTALEREARRVADQQPDSALGQAFSAGRAPLGPLVTELAHDGDPVAREVLELIGTRLGVAFSSYTNMFNPELIIVGGGVMAAGDLLLEPARRELAKRALPPARDTVQVVAARFGFEAGMIGAAALALEGDSEVRA
ncbi:MAG: ROK family protein [Solirubrobacterales bacterium]|nr:ROK family protein [Solirubrobacterales bacterium]